MKFCGININCFSFQDIISDFENIKLLVTVNAEAIVRAQNETNLKTIINNNLASLDGQIPVWLFRKVFNIPIVKISGSDLIYQISEWASLYGYKMFLLGGNEESNRLSVLNLSKLYPGLIINGYSPDYEPYPFQSKTSEKILESIANFTPDIIFVGFGMGKQEFWSQDNYEFLKQIGVKLIVGCGGSFDFASGKIKRAPIWIQKAGLESFWRLMNEFKWFRIKRILLSFKIFYYYYLFHIKS